MKTQPSNFSLTISPPFFGKPNKWDGIIITDVLCATDRPMPKTFKSAQGVEDFIAEHAGRGDEDTHEMIIARVEQWMIAGATAVPREKTLRQRGKFFGKVKFSTLQELLVRAKDQDGVL